MIVPSPIVLTPRGMARLRAELLQLRTVQRPELAEQLRLAKTVGSVEENSEYEQVKIDQGLLESRIAALCEVLGTAEVLDPASIPTEHAGIGSRVTVRDLDSAEVWELQLVCALEADPELDRISDECPLGQALLERRVGECVSVAAPAGTLRYEITALVPSLL